MLRTAAKLIGLAVLVIAGSAGIVAYQRHFSAERKIEQLAEEKAELETIVQRLSDERRVAEVLVESQEMVDNVMQTRLLFVEYAKDGVALPPKSFSFAGKMAHIDALVVKFERDFVQKDDPLRGHSIALFTKIYGDQQSPAEAQRIDEPGAIPAVYRGADPRVSEFEMQLWRNFWKLAEDPAYREKFGVRIANGQGVWGPFEADRIYTISIESDGGLIMSSEPLKGIYREALKRRGTL